MKRTPEQYGSDAEVPLAPARAADTGGAPCVPAGLRVLGHGAWTGAAGEGLPQVAGFVGSAYNPLVVEAAERCLRGVYGGPEGADPGRTGGTAVVVGSWSGDLGTAHALHEAVRTGRRVQPLLFFQSNPNAVVGYVAGRWALRGPVVCLRTAGPGPAALAEALDAAGLLLLDGDCHEALVIAADTGRTPDDPGSAVAVLVTADDPATGRGAT